MAIETKTKGVKILIVEDELTHLDVIRSKLEMEGFEVVVAEDGEEGERLIKELKPNLILLDILLPKKNGFEILEDLKKEKNKIPIIIVSNSGQPVEIDRALKLGVKDYLIKADFSPQDVLEKVRKVLNWPHLQKKTIQSPVQRAGEQCKITDVNEGQSIKNAPKILIVEDDKFLRELITQKLITEGFNVCSVIDGEEAFRLLEEDQPKLILLDLILPGIDGFEILTRLKQNQKTSSIPVIVLSNLGQKEDIDRAMSLKAADYLVKANFTPGEIIAKIKKILQEKYI